MKPTSKRAIELSPRRRAGKSTPSSEDTGPEARNRPPGHAVKARHQAKHIAPGIIQGAKSTSPSPPATATARATQSVPPIRREQGLKA